MLGSLLVPEGPGRAVREEDGVQLEVLVISSSRDEAGPADTLPQYQPRLRPQPAGVRHELRPEADHGLSQLVIPSHLTWAGGTQAAGTIKSKTLGLL